MERWKLARDLAEGDRFVMASPRGIARVTRNYSSETTPIEPEKPRADHYATAIALIICFEMTDGPSRGLKDHVFVHPNERIRIP